MVLLRLMIPQLDGYMPMVKVGSRIATTDLLLAVSYDLQPFVVGYCIYAQPVMTSSHVSRWSLMILWPIGSRKLVIDAKIPLNINSFPGFHYKIALNIDGFPRFTYKKW